MRFARGDIVTTSFHTKTTTEHRREIARVAQTRARITSALVAIGKAPCVKNSERVRRGASRIGRQSRRPYRRKGRHGRERLASPFGIGCALPRARSFQIIPIRMKRATSVRKVALIMATVRNASPAGRGVTACLTRCGDWNRSGSLCPRHHPCPSRSVNKHHAARRDAYSGNRDGRHDAQSRGRAGT
jgi:hypothetical protein